MIEKVYNFTQTDEKIVERLVDDDVLEFFVVKSPSPKNYGKR